MRSIILIGHKPEDLQGAELQDLEKKFGPLGKAVRFLTKNPETAEQLHRLRKRAKVVLVLVQRKTLANDPKLDFEPIVPDPAQDWLAPLQRFSYLDLNRELVDYVHTPGLRAAA